MSQTIEGTWEEIKRTHEAELMGHYVRVTIDPKPASRKSTTIVRPATNQRKPLRARGMFAGKISTEEYLREKREDTLREDRSL